MAPLAAAGFRGGRHGGFHRPPPLLLVLALVLLLLNSLLPLPAAAAAKDDNEQEPRILLDLGPNLGEAIPLRLRHYLKPWLVDVTVPQYGNASEVTVELVVEGLLRRRGLKKALSKDALLVPPLGKGQRLLVLALGDGAVARALEKEHEDEKGHDVASFAAEAARRPGESFALLSATEGGLGLLAGNGLPIDACWNAGTRVHTGAAYAAYEALQRLGFAFWHPLEGPIAPTRLAWPQETEKGKGQGQWEWEWECPRWRSRAFHLHTQHPLELTDVLQGFDVPLLLDRGGLRGKDRSSSAWQGLERAAATWMLPKAVLKEEEEEEEQQQTCANAVGGETAAYHDPCGALRAAGAHCELWEAMVPDVASFFEWAAAHRLNRAEWILLGNRRWGAIVDSPLRQARLALLARVGQGFGLMVGVDDPIAFQQQHSWVMTSTLGTWASQLAAVRARVDWLLGGAGFDFLATESGLSEFSHPNDKLMLALMDAFAERANGTWGKEATIKVHISSNQRCRNFHDPRNASQPLNFNFLPTYATPRLGVLPHTVQAYALDDPTAGVYGQRNFSEMHAYMLYEVGEGRRHVHFYPETSYWVNVDIDVPLFLPTYAERRLHDLHLLAHEEDAGRTGGHRMAGTLMFDSGWEWGYWLSDVLVAAAMWDPRQWDAPAVGKKGKGRRGSESESSAGLPTHLQRFERQVRDHALRALPPRFSAPLAHWLADLTHFQHEALLLGRLSPGQPCPNQATLSGIAYLIGKDTWVELPRWLNLGFTQPNYVGMYEHADPDYVHVRPLLAHMREEGARLHAAVASIVADMEEEQEARGVAPGLLERVRELRDGTHLLSLRAQHVALLYEATAPELLSVAVAKDEAAMARRAALLREARGVLEAVTAVVRAREGQYQAPLGRVAGWRANPTVYHFDFLWTVKSLYYWWREQGQAEAESWAARYSFCYLNRMQPTEVALGVGKTVLKFARDAFSWLPGAHLWADCLAPPTREPEFPRDL